MEDPEQAVDSVRPTHEDQLSRELMDSSQGDMEKLGRKRPAVFKNIFMEVGFCFSILASNLVSVSPFAILAIPPSRQPIAGCRCFAFRSSMLSALTNEPMTFANCRIYLLSR